MDKNLKGEEGVAGEGELQQVEELAYALWVERGCPIGSPESIGARWESGMSDRKVPKPSCRKSFRRDANRSTALLNNRHR